MHFHCSLWQLPSSKFGQTLPVRVVCMHSLSLSLPSLCVNLNSLLNYWCVRAHGPTSWSLATLAVLSLQSVIIKLVSTLLHAGQGLRLFAFLSPVVLVLTCLYNLPVSITLPFFQQLVAPNTVWLLQGPFPLITPIVLSHLHLSLALKWLSCRNVFGRKWQLRTSLLMHRSLDKQASIRVRQLWLINRITLDYLVARPCSAATGMSHWLLKFVHFPLPIICSQWQIANGYSLPVYWRETPSLTVFK